MVGGAAPAVADPEAALVELVGRLVAARGPLRDDDVAWWLGLPKVPVRAAAAAAPGLEAVVVEGVPMRMAAGLEPRGRSGVLLVPGFDEWLLGVADRSLVLSPAASELVVPGGNGVFRPCILLDGRVVGTWRLPAASRGAGAPVVELLEPASEALRRAVERAIRAWPHREAGTAPRG
ncbi:winged helix DNA-binding domain-containing protein [Agrococcus sp. SL85]|nr:winged helix DNA-binding domain-containing protein [Agrococcus sp. SL85]